MGILTPPIKDQSDELWRDLLTAARNDDGAAVQEHFAAGHPVYYTEDDTPADLLVKEYPDGRREWVRVIGKRDEVVRTL
ncbi:hypothetical protein AB7B51_17395 [Acinetobacter baumannii]|uniref:hypothetical protein n=1 Tax=Acinetobacter baumannii TaxID=470 RepID=UPI0034E1ED11